MYNLELALFSLLNDSTSDFEIWADGVQLGGGYIVSSTGTSISTTVSYGGSLPSSLEFRFDDAASGSVDQIEIRAVKINSKVVNTGNFLSTATLNDAGSSTVNITAADFIFDSSEPLASEFTIGATRTLTAGNDTARFQNSVTDEVFEALAGRDTIYVGSGNDKVNGNAGNDLIRGGDGNDLLYGEADDDRLYGDDGDDNLYGGIGNDSLYGGNDNDHLFGNDGNDRLFGQEGDDVLVGGAGDDKLWAGNGNNVVYGDEGDDILVGGSDIDTLDGGADNDTIFGGGSNDILDGQGGSDTLVGDSGDDVLNGGDGDDTLFGDNIMRVVGQAGQVTTDQIDSAQWHSISFDATILNPVIKMAMNTTNGTDPLTLRVRNVTDAGFEWQMDEWDYLDGAHGLETVSWLAISEGTHTLDNGVVIQAGTVSASGNGNANGNNVTVNFNSAFGSAPVVMTQVMTDNGPEAVSVHNENRNASSFRLHIEEEEGSDYVHASETVGWIAIDSGGSAAAGILVAETGNNVTHNITTANFGSTFPASLPVTLIDTQTEDGGDPQTARGDGLSASSVDFYVEEEQANDAETTHTTEVVGYYVTTAGVIYGDTLDGDDTINGGAGLDTLYGGDGADTFLFEAASAYSDVDRIKDFRYAQGDVLDISDLLTGAFSGTITDYVQFVDSGTDTLVQVDSNGLTGGASFQTIASLDGITGLDETALYINGNIIV